MRNSLHQPQIAPHIREARARIRGLAIERLIEALCDHTLIISIACGGELFVAASSASETRIGEALANQNDAVHLSRRAAANSSAISEPML